MIEIAENGIALQLVIRTCNDCVIYRARIQIYYFLRVICKRCQLPVLPLLLSQCPYPLQTKQLHTLIFFSFNNGIIKTPKRARGCMRRFGTEFVYTVLRGKSRSITLTCISKKTFSGRLFPNTFHAIILIIDKSGGSSILFRTYKIIM